MQGSPAGLADRHDSPLSDEQRPPVPRSGRHRLLEAPGRHRRPGRIGPPTVAMLTVVVAVVAVVVGHGVRGDQAAPDLGAALVGDHPSAVGAAAAAPSSTPRTTTAETTTAPAQAASGAPRSTPSAPRTPRTSQRRAETSTSRSSSNGAAPGTRSPGSVSLTGGAVQWRGDFDTGDSSQWALETAREYSLRVGDGGAGHVTAGRFEVRDGDTPVDSGERSEAKPPDWTDVGEGDERWYSFSMMFDPSFPVPADGWCDPVQWHPANADHSAAEGAPPLNLQCGNNGDDRLYLQVGDRELLPVGMLDRGVWHRYLLHVRFSSDPGVAFQEVFRDGQLVLPRTSSRYANMSSAKLYLKVGMYRKGTNDGSMVVWHDDMAIYTSAPRWSAR